MMNNAQILFYCLIVLINSSCLKVKEEKTKAAYYFDLKDFFETEAERLKKENPVVQKMVMLNDDSESKVKSIDDWNNEFLTFSEADINKSAYAGKYNSDTIFSNGKIAKIIYAAKEQKLKTRMLTVAFDTLNNEPEEIDVSIETSNTLYQSSQLLHYHRHKAYTVSGVQKIRFLNPDVFKVEVKF
jgi:hypothetical protein